MPLLHAAPAATATAATRCTDYRSRAAPTSAPSTTCATLAAVAARATASASCLDLVLNHVAREHEWARAGARRASERYRDYFHVFADRELPDAYERTLPEVFPDFAPGNFTWDDDARRLGVDDVQRLPVGRQLVQPRRASASTPRSSSTWPTTAWRCSGSTPSRSSGSGWAPPARTSPRCTPSPRRCATVARIACAGGRCSRPRRSSGRSDLRAYLGPGEHHGKVSDLAYHNSLMVQIWSMLASRRRRGWRRTRSQPLPPPPTHHGVGHLRALPRRHRLGDRRRRRRRGRADRLRRTGAFLSDFYAGEFPGSRARGLVFQENPATGDRRISGTRGQPRRPGARHGSRSDSAGVQTSLDRLFLAHALVLGWGGVPVIWMGDELGLPNDPRLGRRAGPRRGQPLGAPARGCDWDVGCRSRRDPTSIPGRVFSGLAHLARVRAGPAAPARVGADGGLPDTDPGVLATARRHPLGNDGGPLQRHRRLAAVARLGAVGVGLRAPVDAITGEAAGRGEDGNLWLPPYAVRWLARRPARGRYSLTRR